MQGTTAEIISEIHTTDPCRLHEGARTFCCTDAGTRFFQPVKFQYISILERREKVTNLSFFILHSEPRKTTLEKTISMRAVYKMPGVRQSQQKKLKKKNEQHNCASIKRIIIILI